MMSLRGLGDWLFKLYLLLATVYIADAVGVGQKFGGVVEFGFIGLVLYFFGPVLEEGLARVVGAIADRLLPEADEMEEVQD